MSSRCLVVAVESWVPFVTMTGEGESLHVHGSMTEVMDIIMKKLGVCYKYVRSVDKLFGQRLSNGSWSGLMGLITREEADISGIGVMVTRDRLRDVDMSEFLYLDEVSAGYKTPVLESDINGFLKPFTLMSWALILATILCVLTAAGGVRVAYARVSQRLVRERKASLNVALHPAKRRTPPITDETMLWTVGAILAQSINKVPKGDSVRVITGLWLLASLILTTVYRSNLKAMLILPKLNLPFDSLEQLVETELPVWMSSSTTIYQAIQSAPRNTSLGRLLPQVYHKDPVLSIERLIQGHHVLLVPRSALLQILHQTFSTTGQCKNYIMSESFMKTTTLRLVFPKGSSLKERVDPIIWRMREAGILDHIFMKAVYNASECMKHDVAQPNNSLRTLELGDFYGIFIVYAVGVFMASIAFFSEVVLGLGKTVEDEKEKEVKEEE